MAILRSAKLVPATPALHLMAELLAQNVCYSPSFGRHLKRPPKAEHDPIDVLPENALDLR